MKKYLYTVMMLIVTGITTAHAQRMLHRQVGIEVTGGTLFGEKPADNYYIGLGLTINGKKGNYQLWAMEYIRERKIVKKRPTLWQTYIAEGGYSFQLLSDARKNIAFNGTLTGVAGYEHMDIDQIPVATKVAFITHERNFVYGFGGRLSLETYLSDHFVVLVQARGRMLWGTASDQFRPSLGIGIRYSF